jgi:hypothetical protein
MSSNNRWLFVTGLIIAGAVLALALRPNQRDVNTGGRAGQFSLTGDEVESRPRFTFIYVREVLDRSAADDARGRARTMAIDLVFADPDAERARLGKPPAWRVIIAAGDGGAGAHTASDLARSMPFGDAWIDGLIGQDDPAVRTNRLQPGAVSELTWVEEDPRFSFEPMVKKGRLAMNGSVIDKEAEAPFAGDMTDNQGAMAEAGYFVILDKLEPFLRYEWPGPEPDALSGPVSTLGVNYYLVPRAVRFSLSVILTDPGEAGAGGPSHFDRGGLVRDGSRDPVSVRGQFQLLF